MLGINFALFLILAMVTGIAVARQPGPLSNPVLYQKNCRQEFADVDARVKAAGVGYAGYYRVPGFPYLRSNRLMSSYRNMAGRDINTFGTWMFQLREYDSIAREIELSNLGMAEQKRADLLTDLRTCAVWLSYLELGDAAANKRLLVAVQIPRPQAPIPEQIVRNLHSDATARRARVQAEFARPQPAGQTGMTLWQVSPPANPAELPHGFAAATHDNLGRIGLLMSSWEALARQYAPRLLIKSGAEYDRIGAPVLRAKGPSVDTSKPVVYYLISYARVGKDTMAQISYFIWFSREPALAAHDPDAGALDGLIWRVTLGDDGRPLLFDSVSASGFDHLWFLRAALAPRTAGVIDPALIPQARIPAGPPLIWLATGSHDIQHLLDSAKPGKHRHYVLRPYEDLMTIPAPGGGTRSLFGPDGLVPGSQRPANRLYQTAGLVEPGAMREWGWHETSLLGRRFFDDPRLIEKLFVLPLTTAAKAKQSGRLAALAGPAQP